MTTDLTNTTFCIILLVIFCISKFCIFLMKVFIFRVHRKSGDVPVGPNYYWHKISLSQQCVHFVVVTSLFYHNLITIALYCNGWIAKHNEI